MLACADLRPADALLDYVAAAGALGDLPIGVGAYKTPVTEDGLCPLQGALRQGLDDDLVFKFPIVLERGRHLVEVGELRTKRTPRLAVPMVVLTTTGRMVVPRNAAADTTISVRGSGSPNSASRREKLALPWAAA